MIQFQPEKIIQTSSKNIFEILDLIGEGNEGQVYQAINLTTKQYVALKKQKYTSRNEEKVLRKLCQHQLKHFVNILDFCYSEKQLIVIMELAYDNMVSSLKILDDEETNLKQFLQIAKGVEEIHSLGLIHRDLKPHNILMIKQENDETTYKICDTGLMREQKGLKTTNVGTPYYMAPELIKSSLYDEKVDIWAIGLIFYEKLRGWPMFKGDTKEEVSENILRVTQEQIFQAIDNLQNCSNFVSNLLKDILVIQSKGRLSAKGIISKIQAKLKNQEVSIIHEVEQEKITVEKQKIKEKQEKQLELKIEQSHQIIQEQVNEQLSIAKYQFEQQEKQEIRKKMGQFSRKFLHNLQNVEADQLMQFQQKNSENLKQQSQQFYLQQMEEEEKEAKLYQLALEKEKREKFSQTIQTKEMEIKKQLQNEIYLQCQLNYEEELRNLKINLEKANKQQLEEQRNNALNQLETYQTLIFLHNRFMVEKLNEINAVKNQNEAKYISNILFSLKQEQEVVEEDIMKLNQLNQGSLLEQIATKYKLKINKATESHYQQYLQIDQLFSKQREKSIQNATQELEQQFFNLNKEYMDKQNCSFQLDGFIQKQIIMWEGALINCFYKTNELEKQFETIRLQYQNFPLKQQIQIRLKTFKVNHIIDQITLMKQQITVIDILIGNLQDIISQLTIFQENYDKLKEKEVLELMYEQQNFLAELQIQIQECSFINHQRLETDNIQIFSLYETVTNKFLSLQQDFFEIQQIQFSIRLSNDELNKLKINMSQSIQKVRRTNDSLYLYKHIIEQEISIQREIIEVNQMKSKVMETLLKDLNVVEELQTIKNLIKNINDRYVVISEFEPKIKEYMAKIEIEEGKIITVQNKIHQRFTSPLQSRKELNDIHEEFSIIISNIHEQILKLKSDLAELEIELNLLNQSSLDNELQNQCSQTLKNLNQRIKNIQKNMRYQSALLSSNYKETLNNLIQTKEIEFCTEKLQIYKQYFKEAKESLQTSLLLEKVTQSKIQKWISNSEIVRYLNQLELKQYYCQKVLKIYSQQKVSKLQERFSKFQQNLEEEGQKLKLCQRFTQDIQNYSIQQKINIKEKINNLKKLIQLYEPQILPQNYDFENEWNNLKNDLQEQIRKSVEIKCYTILLKLLEWKRLCLRFMDKKNQKNQAKNSQMLLEIQNHQIYFQEHLISLYSLEKSLFDEEEFILNFDEIDRKISEQLKFEQIQIEQFNLIILRKAIKNQNVIREIMKDLLPNLEGNKHRINQQLNSL